ncbi:MAG: Fe-S cluster assembly protein SufD [Myxococcota bacterium]
MSNAANSLSALRSASKTSETRAAAQPEWLSTLRNEAMAQFEEQGIPTRRLEDWKGTNLSPLENMSFVESDVVESDVVESDVAGSGADQKSLELPASENPGATLVFVDGRFAPDLSGDFESGLPKGVSVKTIARLLGEEPDRLKGLLAQLTDTKRESLAALQTAFLEDGVALFIEAGARLEEPLRIQFVATENAEGPTASFPRLLVVAGENSQATLLTEHLCAGNAQGFTNFVSEFLVAQGARIESVEIQSESAERVHFTGAYARVERDGHFDSHVFTLGTGLVRSELQVTLAEPGAETRMRGFYLGQDLEQAANSGAKAIGSHIDHFTTVDHAAPHCTSDEEYRGVMGGSSKGVFRGRVIVRPDAQKTEARQQNPNLLISDKASVDTKPQLEIYADDVRASHGSTIGQLDEEALFFLRARGLDPEEARLLLTRAFAHSVVGGIENETLRATAARRVDAALANVGALSGSNAASTVLNPETSG